MSQSVHPETRNFLCDHCGGEIRIPYDLAPTAAPCPHCGVEITSPPPPLPESPEQIAVEPPQEPEVDFASPDLANREEAAVEEPEVNPIVEPDPEPVVEVAREEDPVVLEPDDEVVAKEPEPEVVSVEERAAPDEIPGLDEPEGRRRTMPAILFLGAMVLLAGGVGGAVFFLRGDSDEGPKKGASVPEMDERGFVRDGWKGVATEQLRGFLGAESVAEQASFVIGGESRLEEMEEFYAALPDDDLELSLDGFGHHDLPVVDREAGVFLMQYERPAQFDIREFFRPVAPLEVRYDLEQADFMLSSVAALENFAMEPVKAMAFFKREGERGLKLDWDTYVQTKYRTLKAFSGLPVEGSSAVFRVLLQEDIPDLATGGEEGLRTYRVVDPGNSGDYVKVSVVESSELGQILAELNWIGLERTELPSRTATVELAWSDGEDPRLELKRVICWEFLGLGGEEGNTRKAVEEELTEEDPPAGESAEGETAAP